MPALPPLIALTIIHLSLSTIFLKLIASRSKQLKCSMIESYDNPLLMMILSSVYLSTGSLRNVIQFHRMYLSTSELRDMCKNINNHKNAILLQDTSEIFNKSHISLKFQELIMNPNVTLANFSDFLKTMEIIYSFEENYINELDDKISLILFTYFFLPFILSQIYLILFNHIMLIIIVVIQLIVLIYLKQYVLRKINDFARIRGTVYG